MSILIFTTIIWTFLCPNFNLISSQVISSTSSCPAGWIQFKNEKCFKLMKEWTTYDQAQMECSYQRDGNRDLFTTLATIKSEEEQVFLSDYIFVQQSATSNVWIGARYDYGKKSFFWNHGEELVYSNWDEGQPSQNKERECVAIVSDLTRRSPNEEKSHYYSEEGENYSGGGQITSAETNKWKSVTCQMGNWFVCEILLESSLQEQLINSKVEFNQIIDEMKQDLSRMRNEIDQLKKDNEQNPIPIGFIYVQLSGQPDAETLWSNLVWKDVTSQYAGLFFRAEGGESAQFGKTQDQSAPALIVEQKELTEKVDGTIGCYNCKKKITTNTCSGNIFTAPFPNGNIFNKIFLDFCFSSDQVRPENQAIRIWKRLE